MQIIKAQSLDGRTWDAHKQGCLEVLHEVCTNPDNGLHDGADSQACNDAPIIPTPRGKDDDAQLACSRSLSRKRAQLARSQRCSSLGLRQ